MSDEFHPVHLRASVRGYGPADPRTIAAALLYDAVCDGRRIDDPGWESHVSGVVLDVAAAVTDPAVIRTLAGMIYLVGAWPQDNPAAKLTAERFGFAL